MSALPISLLINVDVNLTPAAAQTQSLSDLLILGSSPVIDPTERLRIYPSIEAVAADFGTSAVEYLAALLWFQQAPQPDQVQIGRWANADTPAQVIGAPLSSAQQAIANFTAFANPAFFFYNGGVPRTIVGASMAAVTNLNGVASILQTALAAAVGGSTVVWDSVNDRFVLTTGSPTGVAGTISFLSAPRANGYIQFGANPLNNATITLNGTVVTFKTVPAGALDVLIGGTQQETIANLIAVLSASADVQLVKFTYSTVAGSVFLYLVAATAGAGGNALTLAASVATVSGATLSGGSGTDISGTLQMTSTSSGAYVSNGIAAESALEAVTIFDDLFGQNWYAVTVPEASNADHLAIAPYIEATNTKHIYGVSSSEGGILSSVSTTDIAYLLHAQGYTRTIVQYSTNSNPYAVCSALARLLGVDFAGNSTTITLMYKQEPGIAAETLSVTQVAALQAKGANVFVAFNNDTAILLPGQMVSGNNLFADMVTGIDWLAVTIQTALYNLLYTSTTKIPQTDAGMHLLLVTAEAVASQGVTNGLLAPGVWNAGGFGTLAQGDFLPKGFYTYAQPVALQNQSDRAARKSVPIQMACKLAGAVHSVGFTINVNQ